MTSGSMVRERRLWIAAVAALATSLAWLAAISAVLLVQAYAGEMPVLVVALRAVVRVAIVLVARLGGSVVPAALLATGVTGLFVRALRAGATVERVRHA